MQRAVKVIPGGVNSPVRAFKSVGMDPKFIARADGPYVWDVDGRRYLDYVGSWGPMILGHNDPTVREAVRAACERGMSFGAATELEVEIAEFICETFRDGHFIGQHLLTGLQLVLPVCYISLQGLIFAP